ncbi:MAG TPA: NAD(P)/FAD-dependent oxidoreductase [Actinospica sp.]|nr:NAD(P)/FAD-dependent oxidoreductase [Actinospica sp.]HWG23427.1 NAD(P)/FAD-dependent oxidoreductase [Actinospica sp.]
MGNGARMDANEPAPTPLAWAPAARHRVLIIGSGFGGLFAAKALRRAEVDVTVLAGTPHHLFQPLLYQVATGILSQGEIAPATREILRRQRNARVLLGSAVAIDTAARRVTARAPGRTAPYSIGYDSLIVATGASGSYFGHPEFGTHAPGLKSIDDALDLRGRIFGAFELAELEEDPAARARRLTFVVVGAGATGVEMAGQIAELAHRSLRGEYRRIDPRSARILLVDGADVVLPTFGASLSARTKSKLADLGIEVRLNTMVTNLDARSVTLKHADGSEERVESMVKVWAAGVAASPFAAELAAATEAPTDRAGRIQVLPDCTVPGHPEIFVVGDVMALNNLPGVAQVAIQSGQYAAAQITARLQGHPAKPEFEYHDKGSLATIARFSAVASIGPIRATGLPAWLLWLFVHLMYLVGFEQRVTTMFHWAVSFAGRGRAERAVTARQVFGKQVTSTADRDALSAAGRYTPRDDGA